MKLALKYLLIVGINLLCYYQSLDGEFVFDDSVAILKNRDVAEGELDWKTFENIFFLNDFWGNNLTKKDSHKSFRPLTTLSFLLQRHLSSNSLDSRSMKSANLAIHIVNSILLLHFLKAILNDKKIAFVATLLFCVHPIHTEAVCGVVSRSDLAAAFVFLICGNFYFCVFHKDCTVNIFKQIFSLALVAFLSFIGILFKENAIIIMPTLASLDLILNSSKLTLRTPKIFLRIFFLAFFTISIIIFRLWIQNFSTPNFRVEDNPVAAADERLTRILSQNFLYVMNFWLLTAPDWLSFDWSFDSIELVRGFEDFRVGFVLAFYSAMIAVILRGIRKKKNLLTLSLLIVPFAPALGFIKVGFVIAERILYLPSIGFSTLIALGYSKLLKKSPKILPIFLAFLLIFHALKTHQRSLEWRTEHKLFHSALKVVPNNAKVFYNIARISSESKDIEKSLRFYQAAIFLHPNYESAHMNLGNLYRELQQHEKAKFHLMKSVEILEEFPTAWMNLGIVQAVLKEFEASEKSYLKALSYRKNYANCFYNMGNLYIELQNSSAALFHWQQAIAINPTHRKAWSNILAFHDNQKNNHENVLKFSEIALNFLPNDTNILFSRANTFGKLGRFEEAENIFKQIIEAEPKKSIFYANLGVLYHRWGKKELAKKNYEIALSLDRTLKNVKSNLGKLRGE